MSYIVTNCVDDGSACDPPGDEPGVGLHSEYEHPGEYDPDTHHQDTTHTCKTAIEVK